MEKRFTFRLDRSTAQAVRQAAKAERRSVASWIRGVIMRALGREVRP